MKLQRYILISLLLAGAIVLSYFESMIPIPIAIPGFKLGLANIITIVMIMKFTFKESLGLVLGRILIVSLLRGSFLNITFFNSLVGGLFSFTTMYLLSKIKIFSLTGISIAGALTHTIGQIIVVIIFTGTPQLAFFYLPVLMMFSIATGIFNAIVAKRFLDMNLLNQDISQID